MRDVLGLQSVRHGFSSRARCGVPESSDPYTSRGLLGRDEILSRYADDPNVVGAGYGRRFVHGRRTDEPAVVVYLANKAWEGTLPTGAALPRRLDTQDGPIAVDAVETGHFYALAAGVYTARERPAPSGISISNEALGETAGTLGCLVIDNTTGGLSILSNNHVIARNNDATPGEGIIQPGRFDTGSPPDDLLGALSRRVPIEFNTPDFPNTVDAAIARVFAASAVVNQMADPNIGAPSSAWPVIGLLFAGTCHRTLINPINAVMAGLDCRFPNGPDSATAAELDQRVVKVGRSTGTFNGLVMEVGVLVAVRYLNRMIGKFRDQIGATTMGLPGDSGSVVMRDPIGTGFVDPTILCPFAFYGPCRSLGTLGDVLGVPATQDEFTVKRLRDEILMASRTGKLLVETFYTNEDYIAGRAADAQLSDQDRELLRAAYRKYIGELRLAATSITDESVILRRQAFRDLQNVGQTLAKYLSRDEREALWELLAIVEDLIEQSRRDVRRVLDREDTYVRTEEILERVQSLVVSGP